MAPPTFGTRVRALRCVVQFRVLLFLLPLVKCEVWNGCVDSVPHKEICFKIYPTLSGYEAWKNCSPLETDYLPQVLKSLDKGDSDKNSTAGRFVWIGAIEESPGSNTYVRYNAIRNVTFEEDSDNDTDHCLAWDISSLTKVKVVRRKCNEAHAMICIVQTKYRASVYNASAPEACNNSRALSILPFTGCYVPDNKCTQYSVTVREEWYMFENLEKVEKSSLPVMVIQMKTREGELTTNNETFTNSTTLCYVGRGSSEIIRLQLRRNKSTGSLTLWVENYGRMEWPPECVGGSVQHSRRIDPRAIRVIPNNKTHPLEPLLIWCYATDIVTGVITVSNKVLIPGNNNESSDTCAITKSTIGPPPATKIDHKASCLRCMERALNPCYQGFNNCSLCTEKHCGPYGLQFLQWRSIQRKGGHFEEFRTCAENKQCAGDVIWKLTGEGGDCDGDGVFDCDDRFLRYFSPHCNLTAGDPRNTNAGQLYWNCRSDPKRDFVDLPAGNQTVRYYCLNYLRRRWSGPNYINEHDSFHFSSTEMPFTTTTTTTKSPKIIEEETIEELNTLQFVTLKLRTSETLTMNKTEEIISNFSRLFDLSESVLRNAQRETDVSSLPELLETILVRAPQNVSFTTPNLAVSKKQAIGFQLISDKPLLGLETFGENPKQIPISRRDDIKATKVEAAVILPRIRKETTVVVVAFAKGSDFTSCQGPANAKSQKKNVTTVSYRMPFGDSDPIHEPTLPNEVENEDHLKLKSGGNCSHQEDLVRGCINTHVVQVGLLDRNGSYVQLPDGETVDIVLRTKITPMLGQTKTCVYWKPQEGGWASDGCVLVNGKDGLDICRCNHLTHFAQLVSEAAVTVGPHRQLLSTLSICACTISLLGLTGVILAGILAKRWRAKTENKVMLNLAVAMTLFMALFLWASLTPNRLELVGRCPMQEKLTVQCQAAGASLHFAVLCSFCWMLVAAFTHYLRFATLTGPDGIPHFVLKTSLVGWGVPVLPVAVLVAVEPGTYAGRGRDFCYPTGAAFYGAVLAPILLVLVINVGIFVLILRRLFPRCCVLKNQPPPPQRWGYNERRDLIRKMIVCVAFTFLFGLTWYLGLLSFTVWPAYVFCAVMALQGPALFLFFVLGEESIRTKLLGMRKRFGKSDSESTTGFSGSTTSTNMLTMTSQTHSREKTRRILPFKSTYVVNGKNTIQNRKEITGI